MPWCKWVKAAFAACAPLLSLLAGSPAMAAAPPWLLTLLDGDAVVIDGTKRMAAAPGLVLAAGALIETGDATALLRLEGPDQASIDLGPATRAMLLPPAQASRAGRVPALYLLQGWAKLTSRGSVPMAGFVAAGLDGGSFQGALVLRVGRGPAGPEQSVFAEGAAVELNERRAASLPIRLAAGQFYRGDGSKPGQALPRPEAAWLQELPRAFRDTIPLRGAVVKDRAFTPTPLPGPSYDQLAHWLAAEPYARRDFPQRFTPLLRDAAFRIGVQKNLSAHPEWASLLAPKDPKDTKDPAR